MKTELEKEDIETIKKSLQKLNIIDNTGLTWRERLATFFTLKIVMWLSEGTSLYNSDIHLIKSDIEEGLKLNRR